MNQVEVYYQVVRDKHQSQEVLNNEYGTKVGTMLACGAALVGGGGIILNVASPSGEWPFWWFLGLPLVFLLAVGAASQVLWLCHWRNGPPGSDLADRLGCYSDEEFTRLAGDSYWQVYGAERASPP